MKTWTHPGGKSREPGAEELRKVFMLTYSYPYRRLIVGH
jgi:hypothetical protein